MDNDYNDVHAMLGHEPLKLTIYKEGTFKRFKELYKTDIAKINPNGEDVQKLILCSNLN